MYICGKPLDETRLCPIWEAVAKVRGLSPEDQAEFLKEHWREIKTSLYFEDIDLYSLPIQELTLRLGLREVPRGTTRTMLVLIIAEAYLDLEEYFLHLPFDRCMAGFIIDPELTREALVNKIMVEELDITHTLNIVQDSFAKGLPYLVSSLIIRALDNNDVLTLRDTLPFWQPAAEDDLMKVVASHLEPGEAATLIFLEWSKLVGIGIERAIVQLGEDEIEKIITLLGMIGERIEDHIYNLKGKRLAGFVRALSQRNDIDFDLILRNEPEAFYNRGLVRKILVETGVLPSSFK